MIYYRPMTNQCVITEGGTPATERRAQSPVSNVQGHPLALVPQGEKETRENAIGCTPASSLFQRIWLPKPATRWMPQVTSPLSRSVVSLFQRIFFWRDTNFTNECELLAGDGEETQITVSLRKVRDSLPRLLRCLVFSSF